MVAEEVSFSDVSVMVSQNPIDRDSVPDFGFYGFDFWSNCIYNAYIVVTENNLWDWFREYSPDPSNGYMFDTHPNTRFMSNALDSDGHSGASFGLVMRTLQQIARVGYEEYKNAYLRKNSSG